jgi:two-component system response regulator HydG
MKKTILIIDDDRELCEEMVEIFKTSDYIVHTAGDCRGGEHHIKKHRYDVIILDYKLPDRDGISMLQKLREENQRAKVAIMTGRPFIEKLLKEKNVESLADVVMHKPMDPETLLEEIKSLI